MPICVLYGKQVLRELTPWQELFVMIAAGAIDLWASFRRAATGSERPVAVYEIQGDSARKIILVII